jgi:hypothetical protein
MLNRTITLASLTCAAERKRPEGTFNSFEGAVVEVVARCEVLARTRKLRSTDAGATQPLTDDERRHLAAKGQ